jgi:hypothetical protein
MTQAYLLTIIDEEVLENMLEKEIIALGEYLMKGVEGTKLVGRHFVRL